MNHLWKSLIILMICAFFRFCESLKLVQTLRNTTDILNKELILKTNSSHQNMNEYFRQKYPVPDDVPVECTKLKAMRYLSDGHCYSNTPIIDDVCVGSCRPITEKNYPLRKEFFKYWTENKVKEYRCVKDKVKKQKVNLYCKDGTVRIYRVNVVKSCKCKVYTKNENKTKRKNRKNRNRRRRQRGRRRHRRHRSKRNRKNRKNRRNRDKLTSLAQTT